MLFIKDDLGTPKFKPICQNATNADGANYNTNPAPETPGKKLKTTRNWLPAASPGSPICHTDTPDGTRPNYCKGEHFYATSAV
jgi:hypothetical protein